MREREEKKRDSEEHGESDTMRKWNLKREIFKVHHSLIMFEKCKHNNNKAVCTHQTHFGRVEGTNMRARGNDR